MKINPVIMKKTLVFSIVAIFLGVGIQPAIAIVNPKENINCELTRNHLLQTIIDISNNPEITNLLSEEESGNIIESVKESDTKLSYALKEIIKDDEILSDKLTNVQNIIEEEFFQFSPPKDSPFLHIYLIIILVILIVVLQALGIINFFTNGKFIVFVLIEIALWNIYWEYFHDLMDQ